MKRTLTLFLTVVMIFTLAACSLPGTFNVDKYLDEADALIAAGQLDQAELLLTRALHDASKPEDIRVLETYLETVRNMKNTPAASEIEGNEPAEEATEATTEPATEAPAPKNLLEDFGRDEMYRINVFLSNFSEQWFEAYPCKDGAAITFAYLFAKYNGDGMVKVSGHNYYISKSDVDAVTTRFFGKTIAVADPSTLTDAYNQTFSYSGGNFYFPAADGASISYCTVATSMVDNGNQTYTVTFDVYGHVTPHESMSSFYNITSQEAKFNSLLEYQYSGVAVVRDYVRSGNIQTYQLISYSRA